MIDLDEIRAPPGAEAEIATRRVVTNIPLRKPKKTEFFRIRPEEEWTIEAHMATLGDQEEDKYLVPSSSEAAAFLQELQLLKRVRLFVGVTYYGNALFVSEIPLRDLDGTWNSWHESRHSIYRCATENWVQAISDRGSSSYA